MNRVTLVRSYCFDHASSTILSRSYCFDQAGDEGGAAGQLKGGRHMKYAPHTPMSNLLLAVLDKLGIDQASQGDSTGKLEI